MLLVTLIKFITSNSSLLVTNFIIPKPVKKNNTIII